MLTEIRLDYKEKSDKKLVCVKTTYMQVTEDCLWQ